MLDFMNNPTAFWEDIWKYERRIFFNNNTSEEQWIDHSVRVFSETDLHECNKTQMRKEKVIWHGENVHDVRLFFFFYIYRVWRTNRKGNWCNEWLYRCLCSNVMDILLSEESCKMKTVNVGSYPQHIARWFDTDCQEVKQELRKCCSILENQRQAQSI